MPSAGVDRWFVTIDDLSDKRRARDEAYREPLRRLQAALRRAQHLRDEGLHFVIASEDTTNAKSCT